MLVMFIYRRLTSCFKSISVNCIYVAQWDKQYWVVSPTIHIERSYANRILQILMDRIINIIFFEKEKIVNLLCDLYMF